MHRNLLNIPVDHTIQENVNSVISSSDKAQVFFVSDPDKKLDISIMIDEKDFIKQEDA